jgi:hypothetical protein
MCVCVCVFADIVPRSTRLMRAVSGPDVPVALGTSLTVFATACVHVSLTCVCVCVCVGGCVCVCVCASTLFKSSLSAPSQSDAISAELSAAVTRADRHKLDYLVSARDDTISVVFHRRAGPDAMLHARVHAEMIRQVRSCVCVRVCVRVCACVCVRV